jgi:hypothetical protein
LASPEKAENYSPETINHKLVKPQCEVPVVQDATSVR